MPSEYAHFRASERPSGIVVGKLWPKNQ